MRLQVEEQVGWPRKEPHAARPLSCEAWPLPWVRVSFECGGCCLIAYQGLKRRRARILRSN